MVGGGGRVGISEFTSSSLGTYPLGRPLKDDINMEISYQKADYKYVHKWHYICYKGDLSLKNLNVM